MRDGSDDTAKRRDRSRTHDIVLFGATGFTGRLVAEYLVRHAPRGEVRWALAGRDHERLERLREELAAIDPGAGDLPLVVADSHDREALAAVASATEVVCTTVGPYVRHGGDLVAACVEHATDYCDLAGEVYFMRRMIDLHHEEATRRGARIVHCCGFDSIPSDLGTFMVQEHMRERHGGRCAEVRLRVRRLKGRPSGGTIASMAATIEAARDPEVRRIVVDPYALNPPGERSGPDRSEAWRIGRDADTGRFTAPFIMGNINTRVVRRTNALLGYPYGRDFRYDEAVQLSGGARGLVTAAALAGGFAAFAAAMAFGPTRALLRRTVLPSPGEGPSAEAIARGGFVLTFAGRGPDAGGREQRIHGEVAGYQDPGYGATAVMLAESALCLALEGGSLPLAGGVLTPAAAMGPQLLERLRRAGMTFAVEG